MTAKKLFIFIFLISIIPVMLSAADKDDELEFAEKLEVSLAIIGPDDPLYSWWGHAAWIITNTETGAARYYDYGNFSFEQDSFAKNFAMGRLYFLKMASNPERNLKYNAFLNRDITLYTLNVKPADRLKLYRFLENDILPENRIYLYDHFYDNCSTRIRDAMDLITDGEFSRKYKSAPDRTIRTQARRCIHNPLMELLLSFAMNGTIDRPATQWDGMFMPEELGRAVSTMTVKDENDEEIPFVSNVSLYHKAAGRPGIQDEPGKEWPAALIIGAALAAAAFLLRRKRTGTAVYSMILSFLLAIPGTVLFFMACFTDHAFAYWNMNLLFINPFLFVTFAFSIRQLSRRNLDSQALRICWSVTAAGAALSMLLKLIPFCRQDNWEMLIMILPVALLLSSPRRILTRKHNVTT